MKFVFAENEFSIGRNTERKLAINKQPSWIGRRTMEAFSKGLPDPD
jgi:hypothetical protein